MLPEFIILFSCRYGHETGEMSVS